MGLPVRRWVRFGIWMTLAVVTVMSTLQIRSIGTPTFPVNEVVAAGGVVTQTPIGPPAPDLKSPPGWSEAVSKFYFDNGKSSIDLLPAYRWRGAANLQAGKASFFGITIPNVLHDIGAILFDIAGLIWALIMFIARSVYSMDLLAGAVGVRVNAFFLMVADAVTRTGLAALIGVAIIVNLLWSSTKGLTVKALSTALSLFLPLGLLFAITAGARQQVQVNRSPTTPTTTGVDCAEFFKNPVGSEIPDGCVTVPSADTTLSDRAKEYAPGSPVWLAATALGLVDVVATPLLSAFGSLDSNVSSTSGSMNALSCAAYEEQLYSTFETAWSQERARLGFSPLSSAAPLQMISRMWEDSFKASFDDMQYSGAVSGKNISCRQLENQSGTRPVVQAALSYMAGAPLGGTDDPAAILAVLQGSSPESSLLQTSAERCVGETCPLAPFISHGGKDSSDRRAYLMAFGACTFHEGKFKIHGAWGFVGGVDAKGCEEFWKKGQDAGGKLKFTNTSPSVIEERGNRIDARGSWDTGCATDGGSFPHENGTIPCAQVYPATLSDAETGSGAAQIALTFQGRSTLQIASPLMSGVIALLTALAFAWVLLGVLLGMLIAKVGFTIMVGLLPGVLLLMAVPSKGARSQIGSRLFKLMTSWGLASVLLGLTMAFILTLLRFMKLIIGGDQPGSISILLVPMLTLFMCHFMLKKLGLGKGLINPLATGTGLALAAASVAAAPKDRMKAARRGAATPGKLDKWQRGTRDKLKTAAGRLGNTTGGVRSTWKTAKGDGSLGGVAATAAVLTAPILRKNRRRHQGKALDEQLAQQLAQERAEAQATDDATTAGGNAASRARGATNQETSGLPLQAQTAVAAVEELNLGPRTPEGVDAARQQARQKVVDATRRSAEGPALEPGSTYSINQNQLDAAPDGATRQWILDALRTKQLSARDTNGNPVPLANGENVAALRNTTTGELVGGAELATLLTDLPSEIGKNGISTFEDAAAHYGFDVVSTADRSQLYWGAEYQNEIREATAEVWGSSEADVLALGDGSPPVPLPDFAMRTTPNNLQIYVPSQLVAGRTLPSSVDASQAGELLRHWTSHLDGDTSQALARMPSENLPYVMAELDVLFRDSSGAQINALELLGLDTTTRQMLEMEIDSGSSISTQDMEAIFTGHHVSIDLSTLQAAIASGTTRREEVQATNRNVFVEFETSMTSTIDIASDSFNGAVGSGTQAFELIEQANAAGGWTPTLIDQLPTLIDQVAPLIYASRQLEVLNECATNVAAGQPVDPDVLETSLSAAKEAAASFRTQLANSLNSNDFESVARQICELIGGVSGHTEFSGQLAASVDPSRRGSTLHIAATRKQELEAKRPKTVLTPRPPRTVNAFP